MRADGVFEQENTVSGSLMVPVRAQISERCLCLLEDSLGRSSRYILVGGNPESCIMGDYISHLQTWNAREELEDIAGKIKVSTSLRQFLPPPGHE